MREERSSGRRVAALVRHGDFARPEDTASAHSILPLSEKGRAQATAAARPLAELCAEHRLTIDKRIEASSLLRAWQTANQLAEALAPETGQDYHVIQRDEMLERGLGSAANLTFDAIRSYLAADPRIGALPENWRRQPEFRLPVPGAESLMDAGKRTAARIEASVASLRPEDPTDLVRVFVAHSGCLRHAAVVLGALDVRVVAERSMDFLDAVLLERQPDGRWMQLAGDFRKHPRDGAKI